MKTTTTSPRLFPPSAFRLSAFQAFLLLAFSFQAFSLYSAEKYWGGDIDDYWLTGTWYSDAALTTSAVSPVAADNVNIVSGRVTVAPGETGNFTALRVGSAASLSGTLNVSGRLVGTGSNVIGTVAGSSGRLDVSGTITNNVGVIGQNAGSSGAAFVTGSGYWNNSGILYVGRGGAGYLEVDTGGTLISNRGYIANDPGSSGIAIISGVWSATGGTNNISVGYGADGYMEIRSGGSVSNGGGFIGYDPGVSGTVFVGGIWVHSTTFSIGRQGIGYLNILTGGTVRGTTGNIGYMAGSSGTVIVSGLWENTTYVYVGRENNSNGYLEITGSGLVQSNRGYIANDPGSSGTVIVSGAWMTVDSTNNITVGYGGTGYMEIHSGGTVSCGGGFLGYDPGARGAATVSGYWVCSNTMWVARQGDGYLRIEPSGTVRNAIGRIGDSIGTSGTVIVSGLWQNTSHLYVGPAGRGYLGIGTGTVTVGGNYFSYNQTSTLNIDLQPDRTTPYMTITGNASLGGTLVLSGFGAIFSTTGTKASDYTGDAVLLLSAAGFSGNFNSIDTGVASHLDYIDSSGFVRNATEYYISSGLAWNASPDVAHGNFTIDSGQSFNVDMPLNERTGITSGWDGRSLVKNGGGTLLFSAENTFSGTVTVNDGSIRLNGGANARFGALHLAGGEIDFGGPSDLVIVTTPDTLVTPAYDGYRTLTVDSLAGAGDFNIKIDLLAGKSDRLVITSNASGTHRLLIHPADGPVPSGPSPTGDEPLLSLVTISGRASANFQGEIIFPGGATFTGGFDYGPFNYVLEQRNNEVVVVNNGFAASFAPVRGVPGAQSLIWFSQQDNLGKRLGELRAFNLATGAHRSGDRWELWARARASQSDIDASAGMGAFSLSLWGVEIGADKTWELPDDLLAFGFYASFGSGSQDFSLDIAGASATGGSDLFGAGIYAAWLNKRGWFANATLSAARYKNNFDVADQSGNITSAGYYDNGYGVSLETGKRIVFDEAGSGWFAEPAAQFSHVHLNRSNYLSGGASPLSVHKNATNIIRLRGVVRAGRVWRPSAAGCLELAGRLAFVRENSFGGEVTVGVESWRPNLDGNRGEAGASLIWRPGGNCQIYFDYEAAYGDNYKKPWDISLGVRFHF